MGREPKLIAAVGKKGVGKSFATNKMMQEYVQGNIAKGVYGRKVLILDVNDEYEGYKSIKVKDIPLFSIHPRIEIRRVRPFHDNGRRMSLNELAETLFIILETYRNGMLLIEDVNKYISDTMPNDLIGAICTNRHIGLDIILHYQSIGRITPKVWQNLNILRFHKCTDSVDKHRKKYEDKYEFLFLAESMINYNYYELNNKRFFLFVDIDDEKIIGNYNEKLFDIAVDNYINQNYNEIVNPLIRNKSILGEKTRSIEDAIKIAKDKLYYYSTFKNY